MAEETKNNTLTLVLGIAGVLILLAVVYLFYTNSKPKAVTTQAGAPKSGQSTTDIALGAVGSLFGLGAAIVPLIPKKGGNSGGNSNAAQIDVRSLEPVMDADGYTVGYLYNGDVVDANWNIIGTDNQDGTWTNQFNEVNSI